MLNLSGVHTPGDSLIHKMDPGLKFGIVMLLITCVSFASGWKQVLFLFSVVFLLTLSSRLSINVFFKRLKPFLRFFLFTFVMHAFFTPGESLPFFPFWHVNVTYDGIDGGGNILSRLVVIIAITSLFTLTTSPADIGKGIERFLSPLKKIIPNIDELSTIVVQTLNFIPLLLNKAEDMIKEERLLNKNRPKKKIIARIKHLSVLIDSYLESALKDTHEMVGVVEKNLIE